MQSLVEIYDLQQQVKHKLSQKKYQDVEALFASLQRQDLQKTLHIQFIFNPLVDGLDAVLSQLHDWRQTTPESYYPYVFFASFWHTVAVKERGIRTMDHVTPAQTLKFCIANDQFFYWALKTLEFNPECVAAYNMLLEASGRFGAPDWLALPATQPIHFSCADYNEEARAFLSSFPKYTVPQGSISIALPPPTAEEQNFIPLYWLKNILTIDPEHIESRKTTIRFLAPRWYGDKKYKKIDQFLASDYCSGLSELQIKILQREKEYDQITAYNTLPSINYRQALKKREKRFKDLINTHLTDEENSLTLFEYINFCHHILINTPADRKKSNDNMINNIYLSLHHIVKLASPWIIFYRANEIFSLLVSFMKTYEIEDNLNVFEDLARHTEFRNLTSSVEILYGALAANFPLANVNLTAQRESIERYYIAGERNLDYNTFRLHIFILCKMGYAAAIKPVLEKFATENRAINASALCYEIYYGCPSDLVDILSVERDADKANSFLNTLVQRRGSQAILIKSRDLEDSIERSSNPSEKSQLAIEREKLLKLNIQLGDAVSQYDYACSLIASSEERRIREGLFVEAPKVLSEARVRLDQLAYIAYLYAFCAFNARGMSKNLFVMDFWINQALAWDPDPNYRDFRQKVKDSLTLKPMYRYYLKKDKGKIPEEMKKIMNNVTQ
ncbi:DUF4034 domain-containing protein [Brenneria izadpanahii]|uniref:DUF4034 domain-containing protein n=1 Tax=Brenneria izadpanahii TaxID=2722756 RepID=A0ABX7UQZ9_9GAMM|nr:DUF4034 domain-containing protein [Brenneria izadpanahii]QTF06987.1 DUF4034 domain-containing protein [Brenneria izadpanahii]